MTRAFDPGDDSKRFVLQQTGEQGYLEFPLMDPGNLTAAERATHGILWIGPKGQARTWRYVQPTDVERYRWWEW